jgi:cytochrome c nitrite reductase small subunit
MTGKFKIALFFIILVFPGLMAAVTAKVAFTRAESLEFCSSCHTMTPWVENVTGAESDSLASEHFKNKWIQHDPCYTCHTNYGFLGPVEAKIKGVRHVIAYYTGVPPKIELYDPFPNENCLHCHLEAKGFRQDPNHDPIEDILSGKDSCIDCHENLHGVEQAGEDEAAAEDAAEDSAEGGAKAESDGEKDGEGGDDDGK